MRISPSNQTLILAGESGDSNPLVDRALKLIPNSTALQRVTIVAARTGQALVVQADYSPRPDQPSGAIAATAAHVGQPLDNSPGTLRSARNPIEQYKRIQNFQAGPSAQARIDVFA